MKYILLIVISFFCLSCQAQEPPKPIKVGAECVEAYVPQLEGRRVAVLANHTAMVGEQHLVDMLVTEGVNLVGIFSPEHGFRGAADAGEHVKNSVDEKTGIPIWSLYDGNTKRPSEDKMQAFDCLIVDMQDVGLRFYTYYGGVCRLWVRCYRVGPSQSQRNVCRWTCARYEV